MNEKKMTIKTHLRYLKIQGEPADKGASNSRLYLLAFLTILNILILNNYANAAMCSQAHCSMSLPRTYAFCKTHAFGPEVSLPTYDPKTGVECECSCSCVVGDTLVDLSGGLSLQIKDIVKGDQVMTPFANKESSDVNIRSSAPAGNNPLYKVIFSDGSAIKGSGDHTLISPDEKIVSLNELEIGESVVGKNGTILNVAEIKMESESGKIYNLVLNLGRKEAKEHVYPTNNVLSADLLLQNKKGELSAELRARKNRIQMKDLIVDTSL